MVRLGPSTSADSVTLDAVSTVSADDQVLVRRSRFFPIYTANDRAREWSVLSLEKVDPARLQCSAHVVPESGKSVRTYSVRFTAPDAMERWLAQSPRAHEHRHHRCGVCLEWIFSNPMVRRAPRSDGGPDRELRGAVRARGGNGVSSRPATLLTPTLPPQRCDGCSQPMHASCAATWLVQSQNCPVCRKPWGSKPGDDALCPPAEDDAEPAAGLEAAAPRGMPSVDLPLRTSSTPPTPATTPSTPSLFPSRKFSLSPTFPRGLGLGRSRSRSRTPSPRRSRTPSDDERIIHRSPLDESRFVVGPLPSPFVLDQ